MKASGSALARLLQFLHLQALLRLARKSLHPNLSVMSLIHLHRICPGAQVGPFPICREFFPVDCPFVQSLYLKQLRLLLRAWPVQTVLSGGCAYPGCQAMTTAFHPFAW